MCLRQSVAVLVLLAVCVRAYPIQVHDDVPYEAAQHHAQFDLYVTQEQGHDVEVHHKVSDIVSGTGTRRRGLPQCKWHCFRNRDNTSRFTTT
jgi:hypothetical protein